MKEEEKLLEIAKRYKDMGYKLEVLEKGHGKTSGSRKRKKG